MNKRDSQKSHQRSSGASSKASPRPSPSTPGVPLVRPIRWLRDASPEEIAESLLAVDPEKTIEVVLVIVGRIGPELSARIDAVVTRAKEDVPRTLLHAGFSFARAITR